MSFRVGRPSDDWDGIGHTVTVTTGSVGNEVAASLAKLTQTDALLNYDVSGTIPCVWFSCDLAVNIMMIDTLYS